MLKAAVRPLPHAERSADLSVRQSSHRSQIVPLQQVANHSSSDQSADVRGIHVLYVPHGKFVLGCAGPLVHYSLDRDSIQLNQVTISILYFEQGLPKTGFHPGSSPRFFGSMP